MREGWLMDSNKEWAWRFHRDEAAWVREPKVFCDLGKKLASEPALLKRRQHLRRAEAVAHWKSLLAQGWSECPPQWGDGAEP